MEKLAYQVVVLDVRKILSGKRSRAILQTCDSQQNSASALGISRSIRTQKVGKSSENIASKILDMYQKLIPHSSGTMSTSEIFFDRVTTYLLPQGRS